jgi:hypothetical protein
MICLCMTSVVGACPRSLLLLDPDRHGMQLSCAPVFRSSGCIAEVMTVAQLRVASSVPCAIILVACFHVHAYARS